jgi:hypothetical protein
MRLIYDPKGPTGVMTVRPGVIVMLQMVSESTLTISRARTGQLRRMRWHTDQVHEYVRMTREFSGRDTICYICC